MKHTVAGLAALLVTSVAVPASAVPIAAMGTEGYSVFAGGGEVTATYQGSTGAYRSLLYVNGDQFVFDNKADPLGATANLGSYAAGTELLFRLFVTDTQTSFFTGPAERNPDGVAHARVESDWMEEGTTLVSFEDLFNGPFAYNDLSFSFTNTVGQEDTSPVPLPAAAPLLAGAVGGLFALRRRRSKRS